MKSSLKVLVVVSLALALVVLPFMVACGGAPAPTPQKEVLIGGGGVGGSFYPLACGLMTIINDNVPGWRATALATGGSLANIRMVDAGEIQVGFGTASKAAAAYHGGTETFPDAMKINLISSMFGSWSYWMTLDKNIRTLHDLKGKKVALGEPGATTAVIAEAILKGIGLEKGVDYTGLELGEREANEALVDGRADAVFTSGSKSHVAIIELTTTKDVYFIPEPLDQIDAMAAALDEAGVGRPLGTLPAGLYKGMTEDYETFVAPMSMFVNSGADEDSAYTIVKALWENIETLGKIHSAGKEFNMDDLKLNFGYPLHPGALKYYKEVGALTEDPYKG